MTAPVVLDGFVVILLPIVVAFSVVLLNRPASSDTVMSPAVFILGVLAVAFLAATATATP